MFYYVSGTVAHVEPYLAVIDCGGGLCLQNHQHDDLTAASG